MPLSDYSSYYNELYSELTPFATKVVALLKGEKIEVNDLDKVIILLNEMSEYIHNFQKSSPIMKNIEQYSKLIDSLQLIAKNSKKLLESTPYVQGFQEHGFFGGTSYDHIDDSDLKLGTFYSLDLNNFYQLGRSLLSVVTQMELSASTEKENPPRDNFNLILSTSFLIHDKILPDVLYKNSPALVETLINAARQLEKDMKAYEKIMASSMLLDHVTRAHDELESMLFSKELKVGKKIKIEGFFERRREIKHIEDFCYKILNYRQIVV